MIVKQGQKVSVISDLHIHKNYKKSVFFYDDKAFLAKIRSLLEGCDLLVLNGDIFETYVNERFPTKKADIAEVKAIVYETYKSSFEFIFDNKDKIIFISGNHDDILACPKGRREIFKKDLKRIRIYKTINLEFQNDSGDRNALITHGEEEYYSSSALFSTFLRKAIRVWWWVWSRTILKKGSIDQYGHYKRMHEGVIFKKSYVSNLTDDFNFGKVDALVLGHTHKPVITPILYDVFNETSEFVYVNTGYFNGMTNYITTIENIDGNLAISQNFEHNKDINPMATKGWNWIRFPRWGETIIRTFF